MIQLDNGPAGGDYVRYIDALLAQRFPGVSMTSDAFRAAPQTMMQAAVERSAAPAASAPPASRLSAVQAAATAAALTARTPRTERIAHATVGGNTPVDLVGLAVGVLLVLVGFLHPGTASILVLVGFVLGGSMIQRILRRQGLMPVTQTAAGRRPR